MTTLIAIEIIESLRPLKLYICSSQLDYILRFCTSPKVCLPLTACYFLFKFSSNVFYKLLNPLRFKCYQINTRFRCHFMVMAIKLSNLLTTCKCVHFSMKAVSQWLIRKRTVLHLLRLMLVSALNYRSRS